MLETLKKKSRKSCTIRIIVAVVVLIGICVFAGTSLLDFITGPQQISKVESPSDLEALEGKYVSYDIKYVLLQFAEHTTVYEDTGRETVNGGNYLVYDDDKGIFFGAYLSKSAEKKVFDLIDESWSWLYGEIDETSSSITVKGTWTAMTGKLLTYYKDDIKEYIGSDYVDSAFTYYIDTKSAGSMSKSMLYVLIAVIAADILIIIYTLIQMLSGSFDKHIKKYLENNANISITTIENDFAKAHVYSNTWIGQKWTIYMKGMFAHIFANKDIVWAYYYHRTGKNAVSEIRAYNMKKACTSLSLSEADAMEVLKHYNEEQPHMVVGYSKEYEAAFNKNFNEFLNIRYNPSLEEQNAADESAEPSDPYAF